jgi:hypothetical protein
MNGAPVLHPRTVEHLERALRGASEIKAGLAQAAAVSDLAAKEGGPPEATVYLDMLLASVDDLTGQIDRLVTLAAQAVMDRRKDRRQ